MRPPVEIDPSEIPTAPRSMSQLRRPRRSCRPQPCIVPPDSRSEILRGLGVYASDAPGITRDSHPCRGLAADLEVIAAGSARNYMNTTQPTRPLLGRSHRALTGRQGSELPRPTVSDGARRSIAGATVPAALLSPQAICGCAP